MNKTEAAKYLGIGVRTLERHTSDGKVKPERKKGKTGLVLDYSQEALDELKLKLEAEEAELLAAIEASPPSPQGPPEPPPIVAATTLARLGGSRALQSQRSSGDAIDFAAELAARLGEAWRLQDVAVKLTLSLEEAAALSGVPQNQLRAAVKAGTLAGAKIGRGVRVRREDLEKYLAGLF